MFSFIHLAIIDAPGAIKPYITSDSFFRHKINNIPKYIDQNDIAYNYDTLLIHNDSELELYDLRTYVKITSLPLDKVKRVVGFYDNLLAVTDNGIYTITSYGTKTLFFSGDMSTCKKIYMDENNLYIVREHSYLVIDPYLNYSVHSKDRETYIMGRNKYWNLYFTDLDEVTIRVENKIFFKNQVIDNIGEGWVHCLGVEISGRNHCELYNSRIVDGKLETTLLFPYRLAKIVGYKSSYVVYTTHNHPNHLVIYSLKHHRILEILFFKDTVLGISNFNIVNAFSIIVDNYINLYTIFQGKAILNSQWSYDQHESSFVLPFIDVPAITFHGFEDISIVC